MVSLNWGVIGAGRISSLFVQDLPFVNNANLYAIAARDKNDARAFATEYGIKHAYGNYEDLFNDPQVDVVYIGTPHTFHFEQAKAAMLAGKHVLCEKPMTVSSNQCKQLAALAKANNVYLMEAMWTYFLPAIIKAKQWVDEGKIGGIKHVKADFGYPMPFSPHGREYDPELGGGCLLDMGIYPLAIASYFLGNTITSMFVDASFAPNNVNDDVNIFATFNKGKATLGTSFQCKLPNYAYIIGDKGYIVIPDFWRAKNCSLFVLDEQIEHFDDQRETLGFNFEAQAFTNDVIQGKRQSAIMPHDKSILLQCFMENIANHFVVKG